ncbi:hypothetical protein BC826DRAFT_972813 [Russula brevipes]|nr:hypothetical protein BC826DRAFT_972813 [Russula brevipes]
MNRGKELGMVQRRSEKRETKLRDLKRGTRAYLHDHMERGEVSSGRVTFSMSTACNSSDSGEILIEDRGKDQRSTTTVPYSRPHGPQLRTTGREQAPTHSRGCEPRLHGAFVPSHVTVPPPLWTPVRARSEVAIPPCLDGAHARAVDALKAAENAVPGCTGITYTGLWGLGLHLARHQLQWEYSAGERHSLNSITLSFAAAADADKQLKGGLSLDEAGPN